MAQPTESCLKLISMCTLVLLYRPDHVWPVIIGANRDEQTDRPWLPPARHWPDRPEVVAGIDQLAGGSWMGVNDYGVAAMMLNRTGSLGPAAGKRSRGELVLEALDHADAADAAEALAALDTEAYRSFNLVVADNSDVYWLAHRGNGKIAVERVPPGLSMLTAGELNDPKTPRIARYRARFETATPPDPDSNDLGGWPALLTERGSPPEGMSFSPSEKFGTLSHSILALPASGLDRQACWWFAKATDGEPPWNPVRLV
jgi:uncharacterized protein with NRDE domain